MLMKARIVSAALAGLAAVAPAGAQTSRAGDCDRACLYDFVDRYLDALVDQDPSRLPWAEDVAFSENNVMLEVGDGLWGTISKRGAYELKFADVPNGQVGVFTVVYERANPAILAARMKIEDRRIAEVETIVARRQGDGPIPNPNPEALREQPILSAMLLPEERVPRARMLSIADGYFDTLQLNDGTLFTQFDPACNRIENGTQTTNNPQLASVRDAFALGCEQQFRLGHYRYDDRLRARRYPLVDEERGLVLGAGFIDHSGRLESFALTDGTIKQSRYLSPHSFVLLELFKIVNGRIRQVEAVFVTVPYNMPSPWLE
jgi:hypothetical protein